MVLYNAGGATYMTSGAIYSATLEYWRCYRINLVVIRSLLVVHFTLLTVIHLVQNCWCYHSGGVLGSCVCVLSRVLCLPKGGVRGLRGGGNSDEVLHRHPNTAAALTAGESHMTLSCFVFAFLSLCFSCGPYACPFCCR